LGTDSVTVIAESPIRPDVLYVGTETDGVFSSTDRGATWRKRSGGLPDGVSVTAVATSPVDPGIAYVGLERVIQSTLQGIGTFVTTDRGNSWSESNRDLTSRVLFGLEFTPSGSTIAATAAGGLFEKLV
jgi:hypothetical protein